jgi:hypothetical protein
VEHTGPWPWSTVKFSVWHLCRDVLSPSPQHRKAAEAAKAEAGQAPSKIALAKAEALKHFATVKVGYASELRFFTMDWRGTKKIEIRPYAAEVPGIYMACGAGVMFPPKRLSEVIAALASLRDSSSAS